MPDLQNSLKQAGFSEDEVGSYLSAKRQDLQTAGFNDHEIDGYLGLPAVPAEVPQPVLARAEQGAQAQKRVGGLMQTVPQFADLIGTPEGRTKLWETIKQYPAVFAKGMLETAEIPGEVAKGNIDLNTDEGIDQAIGLGTLIATGRLNKMPLTGKTAGMELAAGGRLSRIERDVTGNIVEAPIGGMPDAQAVTDAGNMLTKGDTTPSVEKKLTDLYEQRGVLPAEVAHDAQTDATVSQSMLSADKQDLPGGYKPPPAEPPIEGGAGEPPERPPTYTDAENQILSKISIGEKSPERAMTWGRLYTNFLDKFFPISKAVKEAGVDLSTEDNPYHLARLMSGYVGKADHFLNEATFDFNTYEANGPSLKQILEPVSSDLNGFRAYAAAARALELEGRGVESGFATSEAGAPPLVSAGLDAVKTVLSEGRGRFEEPFRQLVDYQNRVAGYLRDSGVLSQAGHKAMLEANEMYVPFSRVMGLDEGAAARAGSTLQAHNPIRAIKGSARDIVDPIESVVRNTYHFIEMAERNVVGTKLVDMLQRAQAELPEAPRVADAAEVPVSRRAEAIGEALSEVGVKKPDDLSEALAHVSEPVRDGEISIMRDGKRESYKVDPDLARAMKGLDAQSMGMLERALAYPASVLRAGAVLTPDFAIRHTLRDFLYATTTFKEGVFHPFDMARGFSGLIAKDADYWNWLKGGGGNVSIVGMDRRYMQADIQKLTAETGLVGRAWNVLADPEASMWEKGGAVGKLPFDAISKFVLDPLRTMTQFAESASHLAAFKKSMRASSRTEEPPATLRDQVLRAAWVSRDTAVDASRMGAAMRAYNMVTAFANIKLQDTDRVVRALRDNPIKTITMIGGSITVPSMILWAINHDDPDYQEIPQWEKDMFFVVPVGSAPPSPLHIEQAQSRGEQPTNSAKFFMRIPKPWAMGIVFGSVPERLAEAYIAEKPGAFKELFKSIWETSGPDFIPTAAAPIIDQFANRSTFTNRTLIPSAQEKLLPEYQYTPYTTELTKSLGKIIGAFPGMSELKMENSGWGGTAKALTSPILMENYIRGWTGTLGMYTLQAADAALRKTGQLPDPPAPASTLADLPVVKSFVVRYPTATTESIQEFQDEYAKDKVYFDTFMAKAKEGDAAAMQHVAAMGGPLMFARMDGINSVLTQHNQLIRDLYKNPEVPPDEKRQLIDQLYFSMIQVARNGNSAIRSMKGALSEPQPAFSFGGG